MGEWEFGKSSIQISVLYVLRSESRERYGIEVGEGGRELRSGKEVGRERTVCLLGNCRPGIIRKDILVHLS